LTSEKPLALNKSLLGRFSDSGIEATQPRGQQ
jgi:hypothetical protein